MMATWSSITTALPSGIRAPGVTNHSISPMRSAFGPAGWDCNPHGSQAFLRLPPQKAIRWGEPWRVRSIAPTTSRKSAIGSQASTAWSTSSAKAAWASCSSRSTKCSIKKSSSSFSMALLRDQATNASSVKPNRQRRSNTRTSRAFSTSVRIFQAPYLVMERLRGHDLKVELTRRGPLPVAEAVTMVCEALAGLGVAHSVGIVHRA